MLYWEKRAYNAKRDEYIRDYVENVFDCFEDDQLAHIMEYYEKYTIFLFQKLRKSLRLEVSPAKISQLAHIKGEGDWVFAGMVGLPYQGADYCELGHPLKYVYKAKNTTNGQIIKFGSTCVGDFFDIDQEGVRSLQKLTTTMQKEMKAMASAMNYGLLDEYYYHECGRLGYLLMVYGEELLNYAEDSTIKSTMLEFIDLGIPLPCSLVSHFDLSSLPSSGKEIIERAGFKREHINLIKDTKDTSFFVSHYLGNIHHFYSEAYKTRLRLPDVLGYKYVWDADLWGIDNIKNLASLWEYRLNAVSALEDHYVDNGLCVNFIDLFELLSKVSNTVSDEIKQCLHFLSSFLSNDSDIKNAGTRAGTIRVLSKDTYSMLKDYVINWDKWMSIAGQGEVIEHIVNLAYKVHPYVLKYYKALEMKEAEEKKLKEEQELLERVKYTKRKIVADYLEEHLNEKNYRRLTGGRIAYDVVKVRAIKLNKWTDKQYIWIEKAYMDLKELKENELNSHNNINADTTNDMQVIRLKVNSAVNIDPATNKVINNKYYFDQHSDIKNMVDTVENSPLLDRFEPYIQSIIKTIAGQTWVSDKQLKYLQAAYDFIQADKKD